MPDTRLNINPNDFVKKCLNDLKFDCKNNLVIDAGCGKNIYKEIFGNLIGFDVLDIEGRPDLVCDFLSAPLEKEVADMVLVLGSNQYNSLDLIEENFIKAWSWIKPGGYMLIRHSVDNEAYQQALKQQLFSAFRRIPLSDNFVEKIRNNLKAELVLQEKKNWGPGEGAHLNFELKKGYVIWRKPIA